MVVNVSKFCILNKNVKFELAKYFNMKTHLRFIVLLVVLHLLHTLESNAQFTLQRKHYFTMGNLYPCTYFNGTSYDTIVHSGPNSLWNLTGSLSVDHEDSLYCVLPDTTLFFNAPNTNYNQATLGFWEVSGSIPGFTDSFYSYLLDDSTSVSFLGDWGAAGNYELGYHHYPDPKLNFLFPFQYGDSVTDLFDGSAIDFSGSGYHHLYGNRTIVADGYGDLLINGNLHSNCLRIKVIAQNNDSSMFWINNYTLEEYYWFDPLINGPILEVIFGFSAGSSNPIHRNTRYFYANPPVVSVQETSSLLDVEVYPNPVSEVIHFDLNSNRNIMSIELVDLYGKFVRSLEYENSQQRELHVSGLCSGVYILKFISTEGIISRKVIIQ